MPSYKLRSNPEYAPGGVKYIKPLFKAIDDNDLVVVNQYLSAPAFINSNAINVRYNLSEGFGPLSHHEEESTLLVKATKLNRTEIVRALVAVEGIDLNVRDLRERSSLILAAMRGQTEIVQVLIAAGADVNTRDSYGYSALMEVARGAAGEGAAGRIMQALLDAGADVNARENQFGNSALILAALRGDAEIVQALLDAGANVNAANNNGETPLFAAVSHVYREPGCVDVVRELLKRPELDKDKAPTGGLYAGKTPLQIAKETPINVSGAAEIIELLNVEYRDCAICATPLSDDRQVVKCPHGPHFFHNDDQCYGNGITRWLNSNGTCPQCRGPWQNVSDGAQRQGPVLEDAMAGGKHNKTKRQRRNKKRNTKKNKTQYKKKRQCKNKK